MYYSMYTHAFLHLWNLYHIYIYHIPCVSMCRFIIIDVSFEIPNWGTPAPLKSFLAHSWCHGRYMVVISEVRTSSKMIPYHSKYFRSSRAALSIYKMIGMICWNELNYHNIFCSDLDWLGIVRNDMELFGMIGTFWYDGEILGRSCNAGRNRERSWECFVFVFCSFFASFFRIFWNVAHAFPRVDGKLPNHLSYATLLPTKCVATSPASLNPSWDSNFQRSMKLCLLSGLGVSEASLSPYVSLGYLLIPGIDLIPIPGIDESCHDPVVNESPSKTGWWTHHLKPYRFGLSGFLQQSPPSSPINQPSTIETVARDWSPRHSRLRNEIVTFQQTNVKPFPTLLKYQSES